MNEDYINQLRAMLTRCADLLDEVRTGEDFECLCHDAAEEARELLSQ